MEQDPDNNRHVNRFLGTGITMTCLQHSGLEAAACELLGQHWRRLLEPNNAYYF